LVMGMDVIYLAAGQGKRARLGYPKQFARLGGKPIMVHGLEVLQSMEEIGRIIITSPVSVPLPRDRKGVEHAIVGYGITKAICVTGGRTRQESVRQALQYAQSEYVLITEAVRPFITAEFVRKVIETPGDFVSPVMPATSSVIEWAIGESGSIRAIPRERVGEVQMPQKYRTDLLKWVHERALAFGIVDATDDASMMIQVTKRVSDFSDIKPKIIVGLEGNLKITTPLDLIIAEAIYNARYSDRE